MALNAAIKRRKTSDHFGHGHRLDVEDDHIIVHVTAWVRLAVTGSEEKKKWARLGDWLLLGWSVLRGCGGKEWARPGRERERLAWAFLFFV